MGGSTFSHVSKQPRRRCGRIFTFDAVSWTLTAHEARPGHELQFDSMVEHGVSEARALYAFNSTNAEAWGPTRFDQQRFHHFILAQGLLPPDLMRKAVLGEFVSSQK